MEYRGLYTAIITPFKMDGSFDESVFKKLIEYQIKSGVDGIVVLGTTGESPTISTQEHNKIISIAVKLAKGRTKIIAGTGSNCTVEAINHSVHAEKAGADGLLQVSPYYNKPTQKGLYEHFMAVADSVNIPIILYNIQGRCGVNIETPTLLRLARHPNIFAVKEASGNLDQMKEVIESVPSDFTVLSGDDGLCFDLCKLGGVGVVSVLSNLLPKEMKSLVQTCEEGNWEEAKVQHEKLSTLFSACFIETNPQPIKTLMAKEGFCEEVFRLPMTIMERENKDNLLNIWSDFCKD
ncbi:4-hydroxy-tetrahydrodipicolinate synthase [Candidatus Gracilibacteria bacterium]|nr:4-hydroxy-tetrahydrodipicolinate synthase [Candidatus Gracilibacteria bacterium]